VVVLVISVVLSAPLSAVMGKGNPGLKRSGSVSKPHAKTYPRGGPATANLTRYKGSVPGNPVTRLKYSVDRVRVNIVEACFRTATPGLKSREFQKVSCMRRLAAIDFYELGAGCFSSEINLTVTVSSQLLCNYVAPFTP
jgi:hypothetical protein